MLFSTLACLFFSASAVPAASPSTPDVCQVNVINADIIATSVKGATTKLSKFEVLSMQQVGDVAVVVSTNFEDTAVSFPVTNFTIDFKNTKTGQEDSYIASGIFDFFKVTKKSTSIVDGKAVKSTSSTNTAGVFSELAVNAFPLEYNIEFGKFGGVITFDIKGQFKVSLFHRNGRIHPIYIEYFTPNPLTGGACK